jgi:hypothetical protein
MKPAEFSEIMIDFVEEQKRWKSLKVGDVIYDEQPREFEFDYHKMKILEINIEERVVLAEDIAGDHIAELSYFLTEEEFNNL